MKLKNIPALVSIPLLVTGLTYNMANAQLPCGTTEMSQKLMEQHPELLANYAKYETYTQNYVKNYQAEQKRTSKKVTTTPTVYIIPIVFHVLHQNGTENISDAQIFDEMRILNQDWGHMNPDTINACTPHFKAIEGNIQVQFRLAQLDPNGNCTNGIDRIYTSRTNNADDLSKLNQWDPKKYINVWVVKTIGSAGVAGYAYFPWEVDGLLAPVDGVLILSQYIGSIGTSSPLTSRALTHELGHVMNLEHPWGLTNSPGVACGDDGVEDTPDTKGWNHCPADSTASKVCDTIVRSPLYMSPENYQNFMDYSYCSMMFTEGQKARIYAAFNSTAAGRNNLWDTANLIATGVYNHPPVACVPSADFYSNTCFVCQGSSVNFFDASRNAEPSSWQWTFTGASISSSNVQNPVVTFNSLWWQNVSLTVSDSVGNNTAMKWNDIYVSPLWTNYFGTFSEGFENLTEVKDNWLFLNKFNNRSFWQTTNRASSSGGNSLMLNAYFPIVYSTNTNPVTIDDPGIGSFDVDDAITPSVDLTTATGMSLDFDYSCATAATSLKGITETLEIDCSFNCGTTWTPMKTLSGATLTNAGYWNSFYTPSAPVDWAHFSIPLGGGVIGKPNVRFRFEYTSGLNSNNLYIDNINLNGTVGIDPVTAEDFHLNVFPNPMTDKSTISYYLPSDQQVSFGLYDIAGRELKQLLNSNQTAGQHTLELNNYNLSNGVYFIKMITGNSKSITQKIVVIK